MLAYSPIECVWMHAIYTCALESFIFVSWELTNWSSKLSETLHEWKTWVFPLLRAWTWNKTWLHFHAIKYTQKIICPLSCHYRHGVVFLVEHNADQHCQCCFGPHPITFIVWTPIILHASKAIFALSGLTALFALKLSQCPFHTADFCFMNVQLKSSLCSNCDYLL